MNDFGETYRSLSDEELLKVWAERSELLSAARLALSEELQRRSLTLEAEMIPESKSAESGIPEHNAKLAFYIAGGFAALFLAVILLVGNKTPDTSPFILFLFVALFGIPPFGAFWMMYMSIRYEKNPLPLIVLAFLPFTFLWYYFERVRPGKVRRTRDFA